MKRLVFTGLLFVATLVLSIVCIAKPPAQPTLAQPTSPATVEKPAGNLRFIPIDIILDTGKSTLGSYQIEITTKNATFAGLEGGDSAAFNAAPFYDPAALAGGHHLIVAAFSTADNLPSGTTRVARLHVAVEGGLADEMPVMTSKLVTATDAQGNFLPAKLELRPEPGGKPEVNSSTQGVRP